MTATDEDDSDRSTIQGSPKMAATTRSWESPQQGPPCQYLDFRLQASRTPDISVVSAPPHPRLWSLVSAALGGSPLTKFSA